MWGARPHCLAARGRRLRVQGGARGGPLRLAGSHRPSPVVGVLWPDLDGTPAQQPTRGGGGLSPPSTAVAAVVAAVSAWWWLRAQRHRGGGGVVDGSGLRCWQLGGGLLPKKM
jgi:hypothetical protein